MGNEEFDIHEFARLFDAAIASDNPSVKKALRNFMMVASIVEAENSDAMPGPLSSLLQRVAAAEKRITSLEGEAMSNTYAKEMARKLQEQTHNGYSWDQYTTTWPGTYRYSNSTASKPADAINIDTDYIERLLGKGKL